MRTKLESGVTLIELMIVVVIVAIISSIAYPNYTSYLRRTKRTDATSALLRLAAAQEKFYIQNNLYTGTLASLGITQTERNLYTLSLAPAAGSTTTFTATATAPATSVQYNDPDCRSFTITAAGVRGATTSAGADNTQNCWR